MQRTLTTPQCNGEGIESNSANQRHNVEKLVQSFASYTMTYEASILLPGLFHALPCYFSVYRLVFINTMNMKL